MAGGSLTVTVDSYIQLQAAAQRIVCWAGPIDSLQLGVSTQAGRTVLTVPEAIFAAHGALSLKPGGANVLAGYVAGTHVTVSAGNGLAAQTTPGGACPANLALLPGPTSITVNVGNDRGAISLVYANAAGAGTVNIHWGDGTSSLAQAESGTIAHTYANAGGASYTIRIEDASATANFTNTIVQLP